MHAGIGAWDNRMSREKSWKRRSSLSVGDGGREDETLRLWGLDLKREGTVERAVRLPAFLTVAGAWDKVVDLEKKS